MSQSFTKTGILKSTGSSANPDDVITRKDLHNINPFGLKTYYTLLPNERQFTDEYDFISSRVGGRQHLFLPDYKYNLRRAWDDGVIGSAGTPPGVTNTTSHMVTGTGGSPWNYKPMLQLGWERNTTTRGLRITAPANTDIISITSRTDSGTMYYSLIDISTGQSVCNVGNEYSRHYVTHRGAHRMNPSPFGTESREHNHVPVHFNIPNRPSSHDYVLIRGHHELNRSGDANWVSGISFNTNPYCWAASSGISYHVGANRPWNQHHAEVLTTGWHGNWNGYTLAQFNNNVRNTIAVPVAPGQGDRMFYIHRHSGIDKAANLQFVTVKGTSDFKSSLFRLHDPISRLDALHSPTSLNLSSVGFRIPENIIPPDVLAHGGFIRVDVDNSHYNHVYYFTEIGTYRLPNYYV